MDKIIVLAPGNIHLLPQLCSKQAQHAAHAGNERLLPLSKKAKMKKPELLFSIIVTRLIINHLAIIRHKIYMGSTWGKCLRGDRLWAIVYLQLT